MQPNQPSNADVQAVAQFMNPGAPAPQAQPVPSQPAPVAQPTPQAQPQPQYQQPTQPAAPTEPAFTPGIANPQPVYQQPAQPQQPAPQAAPAPQNAPADPFEALMQNFAIPQPGQTQQPQAQPQAQPAAPAPTAPVEPAAPAQPQAQPQQPAAPATPAQNYDDFLQSLVGGEDVQIPDMSQVDGTDEAQVKKFFQDYATAIQAQTMQQIQRSQTIQNVEQQGWNEAFKAYPSLEKNKNLRDTVHAVRVQQYRAGNPMSPRQAAEYVARGMGQEYQRGINDSQVQTTYIQTQPQFGGSQTTPVQINPQQDLVAVQTGGEEELANILARRMAAGVLPNTN